MKKCTKCGEEKKLEEFSLRRNIPMGRASRCKACYSTWHKKHYRKLSLRVNIKIPKEARCYCCKETKKQTEFYKNRGNKSGLKSNCKACVRKDNDSRFEIRKNYYYKHKYSLALEEVLDLIQQQEGHCAICKTDIVSRNCVDHDHETKVVRGILCNNCNKGLGHFFDNPDLLIVASNYLKQYAKS